MFMTTIRWLIGSHSVIGTIAQSSEPLILALLYLSLVVLTSAV